MGRSFKQKSQVHKSSSSAEKDFPILKGTNHAQWKRYFKDKAGLYGTAGREISTGVREDFEPRLRTHYYDDTKITPMGRIVTVKKKWDRTAQRLLEAENRVRADRKREHEKQQGILWTKLIEAIGYDIMDDIKARFKEEYEEALSKNDTFALLELVKRSSAFACRVQKGYLRHVFEKLHQGKNKYVKFLTEFEQSIENLELAGEVMTDTDKTCELRDKLSEGWGASACPEAYNRPDDSADFPTYAEYRGKLSTYDSTMASMNWSKSKKSQDRSGGEAEKKPDQRNQNPKGDRKENADRKPSKKKNPDPVEDPGQVMAVLVKALTTAVNNSGTKKEKGKREKDGSKAEGDPSPGACWNCGKTGHRYFKCEENPAKCSGCGKKGHLGKYCEAATEQDQRHAETVKESKKKKAKKGSAESLTVVSERPLTPETHIPGNFLIERGSIGSLVVVSEKPLVKEPNQQEAVGQGGIPESNPQTEAAADRQDASSDRGTAVSSGISVETEKLDVENLDSESLRAKLAVMHPDDVLPDYSSESDESKASDNSVIEIESEEYVKSKADRKKESKSARDAKWSARARAVNAKRQSNSSKCSTPRKTSAHSTPQYPSVHSTPTRASERIRTRGSTPSTPMTPPTRASTPRTPIPPPPAVNPWGTGVDANAVMREIEARVEAGPQSDDEEELFWTNPPPFDAQTENPTVSPCDPKGMTEREAMREQCMLDPTDPRKNMVLLSLLKDKYNTCSGLLRVAEKLTSYKGFVEEANNVRKKLNNAAKELQVKIGDCPALEDPRIRAWQVALWNGLSVGMTVLREKTKFVETNFRSQEAYRQWVELFSLMNPYLPPKNRSRTPDPARNPRPTTPVTTPRTKRGKHSPENPDPPMDSDSGGSDYGGRPKKVPRRQPAATSALSRPRSAPTEVEETRLETYERLPYEEPEFDEVYIEEETGRLSPEAHQRRLRKRANGYKRWERQGKPTADETRALLMSQERLTVREQEELSRQRCEERVARILAAEAVEDYERNAISSRGASSSSGQGLL